MHKVLKCRPSYKRIQEGFSIKKSESNQLSATNLVWYCIVAQRITGRIHSRFLMKRPLLKRPQNKQQICIFGTCIVLNKRNFPSFVTQSEQRNCPNIFITLWALELLLISCAIWCNNTSLLSKLAWKTLSIYRFKTSVTLCRAFFTVQQMSYNFTYESLPCFLLYGFILTLIIKSLFLCSVTTHANNMFRTQNMKTLITKAMTIWPNEKVTKLTISVYVSQWIDYDPTKILLQK